MSNLQYLMLKQRDHGAAAPPPPPSLIMPKHDEYLGGIGEKKYWRIAGVSAR